MKHATLAVLAALAMALPVSAAPSVTGTWTVMVEGSPHGNMSASLALKQDGTKVTGTFSTDHTPDMAVSGAFVDGELKIETAADGDHKITLTAKLKDDGSLAGYLSSRMGDMKWTASRVEEKGRK
jgi:hypothetical protein